MTDSKRVVIVGAGHNGLAAAAGDTRRATVVLPAQHARKAQHAPAIVEQGIAVGVRQRAAFEPRAVHHQVLAFRGKRNRAQIRVRPLEAVRAQFELATDLLIEQVAQVRASRDAESGCKGARDGRAAHSIGSLEHQHFTAGAGQIGGAHQAVVARADDDDALAISHHASPPAPDWVDADP